ncbi:MAG TPA: LysM peptidoglycan-binding domain-containing protein [Flavisolibacter sp.]|nr:LysM peptidoglycan-binding domain-containing protein [Flavisolibacter sp.]
MKSSLLLAIIVFFHSFVFAQGELAVQAGDKGLFLNHTVAAKENFYSIGRLYNIPPKEIASYNGIDMANGLTIGQSLKIPLTATNFTQTASNGRAVYYTVGQKEGLYRVSVRNNNVLMANLRTWNKLTNDNIAAGQKLIIGYLVSPEAGNIVVQPPVAQELKDVADVSPKQDPPAQASPQRTEPPQVKTEVPQVKEEDAKPVTPAPRQVNNPVPAGTANGEGYFKPQFEQQVKAHPARIDETASAGIFKTSSGWQDARYYALMDKVEPGTIIKIVNPTNGKTIYAKVLGEMSGIRQNQGYDVRISNAAAAALEVADADKFIVRVNH